MTKPLLKIFIGVAVFVYTGMPFEINNPTIKSVFRPLSFAFVHSSRMTVYHLGLFSDTESKIVLFIGY